MHARNRNLGNGYRSNSMVLGGVSTASRISPESSMRGQGAYRSEYRSLNHGGYGRGQSRQFQQPPQQKHGDVFMEAGRLATEYLVSKGLMPPNVLTGKWKNDSFRNQVRVNSMQLSSEGRTSALSRLSEPVTDVGPGRRRYQDDYDSLNSNDMRDRRRSGSFKNYSPDRRREFGRSGSLSDRSRASAGVDGDKDVVPSCQDEQKICNGGDIVSRDQSPELAPEKDSRGTVESTVQKPNLVNNKGAKEISSSSEKDLSMLGDMELLDKADVKNPNPEAGEIMDGNDCKVPEQQHTKDDITVREAEKMDTVPSESSCDLIKFCSFVKVPTKTRSSIASRGSKGDVDSLQNEPPRESGSSVEDMAVDNLPGNDCTILQLDNLEVPSKGDELKVTHNNSLNNSTGLISEVDTSSLKEVVMNEKLPERVIIDSNERGEKRAMNDEITKEENKKPRESAASEKLKSEECLHFSCSLERQPSSKDPMALLDGAVPLPSDEKRLLDITLFPKGDIESCMDYAKEKQLFPGSFKTCDLNLMEASDVNEKHENNSILLFPSTERGKQPIPVDIDLSMSNDSFVSNSFGKCSIAGKGIEVIDLENEPEQVDRDFNNSDGRSENVFTCLDGYSNNTHNGTDISDVPDGYGLMISELLGNEMPSCSSVPTDMNSLHSDMGLHSGEGILADDDSVYMSLGEIPMNANGAAASERNKQRESKKARAAERTASRTGRAVFRIPGGRGGAPAIIQAETLSTEEVFLSSVRVKQPNTAPDGDEEEEPDEDAGQLEVRRGKRVQTEAPSQTSKRSRASVQSPAEVRAPVRPVDPPFPVTVEQTMSRKLKGLPDWRATYHGVVQSPSPQPHVNDPTRYYPNWRLKVNDQCYDPVVARRLNDGSVLPWDYDQVAQIPVRSILEYIHVNEAEGRALKMVAMEKVEEDLDRLDNFEAKMSKVQSDLCVARGEVVILTNQRDNYKKMHEDNVKIVESTTWQAKEAREKLASELDQTKHDLTDLKEQFNHRDTDLQETRNRAERAEEELKRLQESREEFRGQVIREFKNSAEFKVDVGLLAVPANAQGYLKGVEDAQKIWPEVDPSHSGLRCDKTVVGDFQRMLEYVAGNRMSEYEDHVDRLAELEDDMEDSSVGVEVAGQEVAKRVSNAGEPINLVDTEEEV